MKAIRLVQASLLVATVCAAPIASAQSCPTRPSWPTADWPSIASTVATTRAAEIAALEDAVFTLTGTDAERLGVRTDGLIISRHGQIYYERYGRGFTATNPHIAWSVAKSVTSALAGLAVKRGVLGTDDPISQYLTINNSDPTVGTITVRQLMEYSSGLDWAESYENDSYQSSSVLAMLYGLGRRDAVKFITSHKLRSAPGTTWAYSSGDATLLAAVVAKVLTPVNGDNFAHDLLFTPIGMTSAVLERDAARTPHGASYFYATPRDMARFGYLYLNDGCWDGVRYLPAGWVASSATVGSVLRTGTIAVPDDLPTGWTFWLNQAVAEQGMELPWADVPPDTYVAWGHWGQRVIVIPSRDMVIVRTGDDRNAFPDMNELISLCMAVVQ